MLKFITRTRPAIFKEVIYQVQVSTLLDLGFLSKLDYYPMNPLGWNELNLQVNSTGADYTDKSVQEEYKRVDLYGYLIHVVNRLLNPKSGVKRKGILVFTRFLEEAERLCWEIEGAAMVSGETSKANRETTLRLFKEGKIPVVVNVGVLTCLSEDTEILRRNKGWVKMGVMDMSDTVAQYDQMSNAISFSNPIRIVQNDEFNGDFVELKGRYTDFRVTHNHKMLYCKKARNGFGDLRKSNASEIVGEKVYVPVSGFAKEENIEIEQEKRCSDSRFVITNSYNFRKKGMDYDTAKAKALLLLERRKSRIYKNPNELTINDCRFIGFWLGDGSKWKAKEGGYRYNLTQSHGTPEICKWIECVMEQCGIYYTISDYCGGDSIINEHRCTTHGYRTYNLPKGTGGDNQQVDSNLYSIIPYLQKSGTELFWGLNREQYFAIM